MKSFTHPDGGIVSPGKMPKMTKKSGMGAGEVMASPSGKGKTQVQKMKEAGIDLQRAGM